LISKLQLYYECINWLIFWSQVGALKMDTGKSKISDTTCWECKFNELSGILFFGLCTWFKKHGKGEDKEIPREIVDKGCKYFEPR